MDPMELIRRHPDLSATYDDEADVLYLSFGPPRPADGIDLGGGTVLLYDDVAGQVVGLTLIGLRRQLERELAAGPAPAETAR